MDLRNLNTFILVAELSSFTKAAETLGYSQSTVSFQIKQLVQELNSQLFERIHHTIALTGQGREVLQYAHQIQRLSLELKEKMEKTESRPAVCGHIRLAMADSLCDSLLNERFLDFRTRYPGITLKIIPAGTEEMFRLLNHNEADAILTLDSHIYNAEYVIAKEEKVGVHFVACKSHPLCKNHKIPIHQLIAYPFLLTEKGMSYRRLMDERLAELSFEIRPVLEVGSTRLISSLVEQGAGLSLLPDYITEAQIKAGNLTILPVENFEIHVWKQLLYHRDKWVSPPLESVIQYCIDREFSKAVPDL